MTRAVRGARSLVLHRLARDKSAISALVAIGVVIAFGLLAPVLAHLTGHHPQQTFPDIGLSPTGQPMPPSAEFWLGTDDLGRDVLVRAAYGTRISLLVGLAATALATVAGVVIGMTAGFTGGAVDHALGRLLEVILSFPYILVAILLAVTVGGGAVTTILVIAFFSFAAVARTVRGQVLSIREREYVEAARVLGAGSIRLMLTEVLPNLTGQITVLASLLLPAAIIFEATLSFLGAGVEPTTPTWGGMLGAAHGYYGTAWWLLLAPAVPLLATTIAGNLLGDAVRDAVTGKRSGQRSDRRSR